MTDVESAHVLAGPASEPLFELDESGFVAELVSLNLRARGREISPLDRLQLLGELQARYVRSRGADGWPGVVRAAHRQAVGGVE